MATAFPVSPILRLRRSPQSANYTMTVAWQTVYTQTQAFAWMFASAKIDLTNMILGDHIEIRVSTRHVAGGAWVVEDVLDYDDDQPANKEKVTIGSIIDTFGVLIEMRQTTGVLKLCYCEFFDAVR